jgi:hypothetical protein
VKLDVHHVWRLPGQSTAAFGTIYLALVHHSGQAAHGFAVLNFALAATALAAAAMAAVSVRRR